VTRRAHLLMTLALLLAAFASFASYRTYSIWMQPLVLPQGEAILTVPPGQSLRTVLADAEKNEWIQGARILGWLAGALELDQHIKAGEYQLATGITAGKMIQVMAEGRVIQYRVTLPEGITFREALNVIRSHPKIARTPDPVLERALVDLTGQSASLEGLFLPETWSFSAGDSELAILRRAHHALSALLESLWAAHSAESVLPNAYAALTLASIVEKETGVAVERPQIAAVFLRRLREGMRLQTDPTVIYGLGDEYDGNLKRSHLRDTRNPYNTYIIEGLPPSPIALPGEAAIRAVFEPADTEALYFVAKGDGSHAFSATLSEHQANVRRFQIERRADYRSSPNSPSGGGE
jgi:UPF0755 protein